MLPPAPPVAIILEVPQFKPEPKMVTETAAGTAFIVTDALP